MLRSDLLDALFWVFALLAAVIALGSVKRGRRFLEYVEDRLAEAVPARGGQWPPAALIVPVKGSEPGLARHLRSLAALDYPNYELVIVCADSSDPALAVAREAVGGRSRLLVAGDPPEGTGEKVHNLTVAIEAVCSSVDVLAFADSDGEVRPSWLRGLVAPLLDGRLGATTGFRWHFPADGGFWPLLRSVWDASIVTVMDTKDRSFAWGGAMALRRQVLDEARVLDYWQGAVSDDYRLAEAVLDSGRGVRFVPQAMVETTSTCTGRQFLAWAVRQLVITRVYSFRKWLAGCLSHIVYTSAQVLCILQALGGNPLAGLGALLLITLPGMATGSLRAYFCSLAFPHRDAWLERHGWTYFWMAPLATWVWLYAFVRSGLSRRIVWRGRTYQLLAPDRTREMRTP